MAETTYFAEATNAREYLEALEQSEGLYLALREDAEEMVERLSDLGLETIDLDSVIEALHTAENAASDARTAFEKDHGDLLELVGSGKSIPGLDAFFADCAS